MNTFLRGHAEILQRLETEGILDQTLIILMGDNGISHARGKQFLYDEGIRTPFIVRGPGIARGAVRTDLIEHTPAGKARKEALRKNSALMKQWAKQDK